MNKLTYNVSTNEQTITALTTEEAALHTAFETERIPVINWALLREQRNRLLAETDWSANADVTMSDKMKTYRQALRDLPANTSDPANPVWPVKPGGQS